MPDQVGTGGILHADIQSDGSQIAEVELITGATAGTKANVASSASSVTLQAANASRRGWIVFNDSTAVLYLNLAGGTASATAYSVQIAAGGFFELAAPYTGAITGIWAAANGSARVTEFA